MPAAVKRKNDGRFFLTDEIQTEPWQQCLNRVARGWSPGDTAKHA
jgi:hypothetical protein